MTDEGYEPPTITEFDADEAEVVEDALNAEAREVIGDVE